MRDVDKAIADLAFIQARMAASTRFRGFAPYAVAATGVLALAIAVLQTILPEPLLASAQGFVLIWIAVAMLSLGLISIEALGRSRRLHGSLADTMIAGTLRTALPFCVVGAIATSIITRFAPDTIWALPGIWQLLVALLGFATLASLPRSIAWASGWYLFTGALVLGIAAHTRVPTPWMMGLPFGIGQVLLGFLLNRAADQGASRG